MTRETWISFRSNGIAFGFVVKGDKGAIQFWVNCHGPLTTEASLLQNYIVTPIDLGYHAREPQHEGQKPTELKCDILGCPCYYDGTSLGAQELFDQARREGNDVIWAKLEEWYVDQFGEAK